MGIKVALIGYKGHWKNYISEIKSLPDVEWTAFAPGSPEEGEQGVLNFEDYSSNLIKYESWQNLLEKENIQVAVVSPPNYLTSEISIACAKRKIHVLSEKPLALELSALKTLKETFEENKVKMGVMFQLRYSPHFFTAWQLVKKGAIGKPVHANGQKSYKLGQRAAWMRIRKTFGGTIPWVAIHAIDFVRFVTGLEYTYVYATHENVSNPDHNELEDVANLLFKFEKGGSATITADYLRPEKAPTHEDDRLRVCGSKGVIEVMNGKITLINGEGVQYPKLEKPPNQFEDFLEGVFKGKNPLIGFDEGFKVTEIALKARDSADNGTRVALR